MVSDSLLERLFAKTDRIYDTLHFLEFILTQGLLLAGHILVVLEGTLIICLALYLVTIFIRIITAKLIHQVPLLITHHDTLVLFGHNLLGVEVLIFLCAHLLLSSDARGTLVVRLPAKRLLLLRGTIFLAFGFLAHIL